MSHKSLPEYGLHHVGYVVADRDAAVKAFADSCGIEDVKLIGFKAGRAWLYGNELTGPDGTAHSAIPYEMKIAMLTLAGNPTAIEIIEPVSDGPHMDFVKQTGGGIHHIGFDVNDAYDYWKEQLLSKGAEPLFESETEDEAVGYRRCLYVKAPGGNVIEVKETPYFRNK